MSNIEMSISMPLDGEGFFRRECPLCLKEFKILLKKEELGDIAQTGLASFMIDSQVEENDTEQNKDSETEFFCPYCKQQASKNSWWTQEQLAYINVFAKNILAKLVNEHLINPLRNLNRSTSGLQFKGEEMEQQEPWISPEANDMDTFDLPCCQRKIKIKDNWHNTVHCFFCGFPHKHRSDETQEGEKGTVQIK